MTSKKSEKSMSMIHGRRVKDEARRFQTGGKKKVRESLKKLQDSIPKKAQENAMSFQVYGSLVIEPIKAKVRRSAREFQIRGIDRLSTPVERIKKTAKRLQTELAEERRKKVKELQTGGPIITKLGRIYGFAGGIPCMRSLNLKRDDFYAGQRKLAEKDPDKALINIFSKIHKIEAMPDHPIVWRHLGLANLEIAEIYARVGNMATTKTALLESCVSAVNYYRRSELYNQLFLDKRKKIRSILVLNRLITAQVGKETQVRKMLPLIVEDFKELSDIVRVIRRANVYKIEGEDKKAQELLDKVNKQLSYMVGKHRLKVTGRAWILDEMLDSFNSMLSGLIRDLQESKILKELEKLQERLNKLMEQRSVILLTPSVSSFSGARERSRDFGTA